MPGGRPPEILDGPACTETAGSRTREGRRNDDAEARTEAPDLPAGRRGRLWAAELPVEQAALSPGPARPGAATPLRVPHPAAGEAEAPRDVRDRRAAVPPVLPRGEPPGGRDRRGAAPPA